MSPETKKALRSQIRFVRLGIKTFNEHKASPKFNATSLTRTLDLHVLRSMQRIHDTVKVEMAAQGWTSVNTMPAHLQAPLQAFCRADEYLSAKVGLFEAPSFDPKIVLKALTALSTIC